MGDLLKRVSLAVLVAGLLVLAPPASADPVARSLATCADYADGECDGGFHSEQSGFSALPRAGSAAPRLRAYVSCGVSSFRPSHYCFIGDAPHAVFYDASHSSRRYKVCLRGPGGRFCVRARQRGGNASQVNLLRFNERIGTYTVKWFVRGKRGSVRSWNFYFAQGD
jgi:hypothetical protein